MPRRRFRLQVRPPQYNAARCLAQLAVNIVDFIDNDDYITPFNWNPNLSTAMDPVNLQNAWVFGTELPRLVINEVYANLDNDYVTPLRRFPIRNPLARRIRNLGQTGQYNLGVWVELLNPLTPPNQQDDPKSIARRQGAADLSSAWQSRQHDAQSVYQLVITKYSTTYALPTYLEGVSIGTSLAYQGSNVDGSLPTAALPTTPNVSSNTTVIVSPLADTVNQTAWNGVVQWSNGQQGQPVPNAPGTVGGNPGFYVVGPQSSQDLAANSQNATIPGTNGTPVSWQAPKGTDGNSLMMWQVPNNTGTGTGAQAGLAPTGTNIPTMILLQRLLCPHLAPNPVNASGALTNPQPAV